MSEERPRRRRPRVPKPELPLAPEPLTSESTLGVLRNRRFLALWLAQAATQVGANMVLFGLTVQIAEATRSTSAVSLLILTFLVPAVAFSAIAGVYVDRYDRRLILIVTNLLRAVAFLAMVAVDDRLAFIYLLNIFVSTATTFFAPAEASMIPVLVDRRQLLAANGIFTFTLQASFALGFALLGPLLVNLTGVPVLLVTVSLLYFVATGLCFVLPRYAPPQVGVSATEAIGQAEAAVAGTVTQLREGVAYIRSNRSIFWSLTYLAVTASLIGVLGVLGPAFAVQALGLGTKDFVVVVLPLALGLVTGILVLNSYGRLLPRRRVIEGGLVTVAVMLALLSAAGPISRFLSARADTGLVDVGPVVSLLAIVVLLAFGVGVAYAFVAVPAQTQLQEELPEDVRGRVFGVLNMLVSIASFVPIIVVGPIADLVGTPVVIFLSALLVGVAGIVSIVKANATIPGTATPGTHGAPVDPIAVATVPLPHAEAGHPLFDFSFSHAPAAAAAEAGGPAPATEGAAGRDLGFRQAADWIRMRLKRSAADPPAQAAEGAVERPANEPAARRTEAPTNDSSTPPAPLTDGSTGPAAVGGNDPEPSAAGSPERPTDEAPAAEPVAATPARTPAVPADPMSATPAPADPPPAASRRAPRWQPAVPVAPIVGEGSTPDEAPVEPPFVAPPDAATTSWRIPAAFRPGSSPEAALPPVTADPSARRIERPAPADDEEAPRRRRRPFAAREARSSPVRPQPPSPADPDEPTETRLPVFRPDPRDVEDEGSRGGMG